MVCRCLIGMLQYWIGLMRMAFRMRQCLDWKSDLAGAV